MRVSSYKEHDRNYKFYTRKKIKGETKQLVYRSYSFVVKGILKHEMYLKPLNPKRITEIIGTEYGYKLIMKPNKPINLEYDSKNKRTIELVLFFRK